MLNMSNDFLHPNEQTSESNIILIEKAMSKIISEIDGNSEKGEIERKKCENFHNFPDRKMEMMKGNIKDVTHEGTPIRFQNFKDQKPERFKVDILKDMQEIISDYPQYSEEIKIKRSTMDISGTMQKTIANTSQHLRDSEFESLKFDIMKAMREICLRVSEGFKEVEGLKIAMGQAMEERNSMTQNSEKIGMFQKMDVTEANISIKAQNLKKLESQKLKLGIEPKKTTLLAEKLHIGTLRVDIEETL